MGLGHTHSSHAQLGRRERGGGRRGGKSKVEKLEIRLRCSGNKRRGMGATQTPSPPHTRAEKERKGEGVGGSSRSSPRMKRSERPVLHKHARKAQRKTRSKRVFFARGTPPPPPPVDPRRPSAFSPLPSGGAIDYPTARHEDARVPLFGECESSFFIVCCAALFT